MLGKLHPSNHRAAAVGLALLITLAALAAACSPAAPQPTQPAAQAKVRVGYLATDLHHMSHIVARDLDMGGGQTLYQKYGLNIEDAVGAPYENGGVVMDRFAAGDADIGLLGLPPAIIKHLNSGTGTTILSQVNEIGSSIVVGKDINRFADLEGETVAVPSHSSIQFFLLLTMAEKEGVDPSKITIIDMAVRDMRTRLDKGEIAGFVAWEPFPSDAIIAGSGKLLATSQDIWPNHPDCVVVADKKFASANPDTVKKFLDVHTAAIQWINDALARPDSKEYAKLIELGSKFTGRDAAVLKEAYKGIRFRASVDAGFRDNLVEFTNKLIQFKVVPQEKLGERGYKSVAEFAAAYVQPASGGAGS